MEQADMEARVTRLEAPFAYIRGDLDDIKAEQRVLAQKMEARQSAACEKLEASSAVLTEITVEFTKRPTTAQYWGMIGTVAAISLATVGIVSTGIVGGLGWLSR